jgi:FkbM family methyltransferase
LIMGIKKASEKSKKIIKHLYKGTLIDAVKNKYKQFRWNQVKLQGKGYIYRLCDSIKIKLYPDDVLSEIIFKENFEKNEQLFVRKFLKPGDIFFDIGANIGLFTLIGAYSVSKTGHVFAFEPCAAIYNRLLENININHFSNVKSYQMAISDKMEAHILTKSIDGYGAWNSLAHPTAGSLFDQEIVQCITIDTFVTQNKLEGKIVLMKIDIEGWELYALNGAKQTLTRNDAPDLLIEFTEINAQSAGTSCSAVYNRLLEFGYKMYSIDINNRILAYDPLRESYPYLNLLATKRIDFVCRRLVFAVA